MLTDPGHDLRYAIRALARAKASAAVLILSLAAGLGANAVLYRAIDALLFRPPAGVVRSSRLVTIVTSQFNGASNGLSSLPDARSLATGAPGLARLAAFDAARVDQVRLGDSGQRVRVVETEPALFDVLGGAPELGKRLASGSRADGRPPAVISDDLWTTFGRPHDIVDRELRVGDRAYAIAGVGPAGFRGLEISRPSDVWIPLEATLRVARGDRRLSIVGRLADGVDLEIAQQQARLVAGRLASEFPETNRGARGDDQAPRRLTVLPWSRMNRSSGAPILLLGTAALGATLMLLVSACVNAASVMVSRSAARRRELAVRVALGVSRARLVRHALVEGWLLASCGAALGLLLAHYTVAIVPAQLSPEDAETLALGLDARIVAGMIVFALAAGAFFAIGPARHAVTTRDVEVLRAGPGQVSSSSGGSITRRVIVTGQIALSTVILIATGVLVRATSTALEGDAGASGRQVAIALVDARSAPPDVAGLDYQTRAHDAIRKLPGVANAAWVMTLPLRQPASERFTIDAPQGLVETMEVDVNIATGDYFATLDMTRLEGRTFDARDRPRSEPVVIVNDVLAQRYFGSAALGQYLHEANGRRLKIVGVVRSVRYRTFEQSPEPALYFPPLQRDGRMMHLMVKTTGPAALVLDRVREALRSTSERAQVVWTKTLDDHVSQALTIDRVLTTVVAACGLLALALSTIGVYGVSADAVQRRTGEIGLRVALGARPGSVAALIGREALLLTLGGVSCGAIVALALAALARTVVHGLPWPNLATLLSVSVALVFVALAAATPPSWRALRISPTIALRTE